MIRRPVAGRAFRAGRPRLLREINQRSVVEVLQQHGPLTRAQIADLIGVSKPTVADVSSELLAAGLLRQVGRTRGSVGPRAALYELAYEAAWVVGVDVGRRWTRVALADLSGTIVARQDERAQLAGAGALVGQIGRLARALAEGTERRWEDVVHVTVGGPGVVDPAGDRVVLSPNVPAWDQGDLLRALPEELDVTVEVENDVNLAALGELWQGHGREFDDFVYLWIGTGVGAGLVLGGELYRGGHGLAGEVGYLPVGVSGPATAAGRRGAFEEAVAADAIASMAEEQGLGQPARPERVFEAARGGDPAAETLVRAYARRLAKGVASIAAVVDPEAIILGGGVGSDAGVLLAPLEQELARLSPLSPRLLTAELGTDGVLHGAVGTALTSAWDHVIERATAPSEQDDVVAP